MPVLENMNNFRADPRYTRFASTTLSSEFDTQIIAKQDTARNFYKLAELWDSRTTDNLPDNRLQDVIYRLILNNPDTSIASGKRSVRIDVATGKSINDLLATLSGASDIPSTTKTEINSVLTTLNLK